MTCNLINNESELISAFNSVSNSETGNEWVIFGYDGKSSIIKVEAVGNGGFNQLIKSFDNSKTQYGFTTIISNIGTHRKVILIHWQGEGVPTEILSSTISHIDEIRKFVCQVNITIYARNEEDLEKEILEKHFENSSVNSINNNTTTPFIPPIPAIISNQCLKQEINLNEREKFWKKMRDEEELRRKEEANKRKQLQEQYAYEQQQMTEKLHKIHLKKIEEQKQQQFGKSISFDSSSINTGKMGKLISGRTQMFEQKVAELVQNTTKPLKKPKNFKWQVNLQSKQLNYPINKVPEPPPKQFECILKKKEDNKQINQQIEINNQLLQKKLILNKIPVAPIPPVARIPLNQQIDEQKLINFEEKILTLTSYNGNNISPPSTENEQKIINEQNNNEIINLNCQKEQSLEIKAKALWDYQADVLK
ncbi:hypothetical protein Mgra_00001514 [Meloidogyne graminicola]|uniref:ADF-H domain-containing protein n=1 Tax=Meloidogyne graminicola TaxID=189291 RepID=A0A8T0A0G2_9BILA|nr:hypothetical protein Mgra_00001514 [Meloidogyne graminicola]